MVRLSQNTEDRSGLDLEGTNPGTNPVRGALPDSTRSEGT